MAPTSPNTFRVTSSWERKEGSEASTTNSKSDALAAHVRDELGISEHTEAQPLTAALASAGTFAVGAALPLVTAWAVPEAQISLWVTVLSLVFLGVLGAVGAGAGGAPIGKGVMRVVFWGAVAMAVTALVGKLFGTAVA